MHETNDDANNDDRWAEEVARFREDFDRLRDEVATRIVGQREIVDGVLTSLIAGGHVLLEGVPGLGKTMLVRTLSEVLETHFSRIQFTPDLMPADLIGTDVLVESEGSHRFEFQRGPVFADVVLADEINRATPKTQSALLEAMQEHSVTTGGVTHDLGEVFFVLATQNPLEMEGTYPLPEAQLDRFLMKLLVEFPSAEDMEEIMDRTTGEPPEPPKKVIGVDRLIEMRHLARRIPIADTVRRYAIDIVMATHPAQTDGPQGSLGGPSSSTTDARRFIRYGSSPRGAQALIRCAKIRAILDNRFHVAREDIRDVAHATLRHRVMLNFEGQADNVSTDGVIDAVLTSVDEASRAKSA